MLVSTRRDLRDKADAPAMPKGLAPGACRLAGVAWRPQAPTLRGKVPQTQALLPLFHAVPRRGLERHASAARLAVGFAGRERFAALHAREAAP